MNKTGKIFSFGLVLITSASFASDPEDIWLLDLELENRRKSTIENFPLQEIESEALSNAAITDALQVKAKPSKKPKAAYEVQDEEQQFEDKKEVSLTNELEDTFDIRSLETQLQIAPPTITPVYSAPNGRTMGEGSRAFVSEERY